MDVLPAYVCHHYLVCSMAQGPEDGVRSLKLELQRIVSYSQMAPLKEQPVL